MANGLYGKVITQANVPVRVTNTSVPYNKVRTVTFNVNNVTNTSINFKFYVAAITNINALSSNDLKGNVTLNGQAQYEMNHLVLTPGEDIYMVSDVAGLSADVRGYEGHLSDPNDIYDVDVPMGDMIISWSDPYGTTVALFDYNGVQTSRIFSRSNASYGINHLPRISVNRKGALCSFGSGSVMNPDTWTLETVVFGIETYDLTKTDDVGFGSGKYNVLDVIPQNGPVYVLPIDVVGIYGYYLNSNKEFCRVHMLSGQREVIKTLDVFPQSISSNGIEFTITYGIKSNGLNSGGIPYQRTAIETYMVNTGTLVTSGYNVPAILGLSAPTYNPRAMIGAYSPDGKYYATCSNTYLIAGDGTPSSNTEQYYVVVYDTSTKQPIFQQQISTTLGQFTGILWSPKGKYFTVTDLGSSVDTIYYYSVADADLFMYDIVGNGLAAPTSPVSINDKGLLGWIANQNSVVLVDTVNGTSKTISKDNMVFKWDGNTGSNRQLDGFSF